MWRLSIPKGYLFSLIPPSKYLPLLHSAPIHPFSPVSTECISELAPLKAFGTCSEMGRVPRTFLKF